MWLTAKILGIEAGGKSVVIINKDDAEEIGVTSLARVNLRYEGTNMTAIVNTATKTIKRGYIGVYEKVKESLNLQDGSAVYVTGAGIPTSLRFIINKLKGRKLAFDEIREIVKDVVKGNLSDIEIASFIVSLNHLTFDLDEAKSLSLAMVETGENLKLERKKIVDKHSIGGIPGDKTSLLVVPIIAACGLPIPKTSSRAITSAAGTADRAEVLMNVELDINEMKRVVEKTNGCIVWGGTVHLAPADDIFIQIEHSLSIDPLLLPSIMSKKKAVGANYLVIDIPCGRGAKIKTIGDAEFLAKDFIELGEALKIKTSCAITFGEQPIGHCIGPALEAREALETLMGSRTSPDLVDKAIKISTMILEMAGYSDAELLATNILNSGNAEKKLREIISEQGGNPLIQPNDVEIGKHHIDVRAEKEGYILWINNHQLTAVANVSGSPKAHGAGILLHKKISDKINKNEKILTIYAEKASKLEEAKILFEERNVIGIGDRMEMLIEEIRWSKIPILQKSFSIDR